MVHTPTLLLINVLVTATLALSLGVVSSRERRDGLFWWAAALAIHTLAYTLYGLRGQVPDWASVLLANTLLAAYFALILEGLFQFQQRVPSRLLIWGPVLLLPLLLAMLLEQIQARVVVVGLLFTLQAAYTVHVLMQRRRETPGRGQYFVVAAYGVLIVMMLGRVLLTFTGGLRLGSITDSNLIQAITFVLATLCLMLISLGLVLMTKEQADARNRRLALQDDLTGLHNRRFIFEVLGQQLALAERHGWPMALLIVDVDHFKRVNDTHGHLVGDQVLRELATCIRGRLRAQDIAGRWGGEEFIVLLPDTDAAGATVLAEDLRLAVMQHRCLDPQGQPLPLTVSIGLHAQPRPTGAQRDELLAAADQAMYQAKRLGRNRVERV
ncbi:MAG: GGDEF domain-containing protein [Hylemonella sp.]|uniref:GGDEF domain-containing protein n=1 Tax=Hylemonella sp. TaxID=2066020 RepID=UPI0022C3CEE8|nr:GGDEF domain-containing protein [Hylemonella sp.]MCZ8252796.1 GGDEF domain-containing protein [Hylemonella sp.]